jgi:hypothetical protein
MWHFLFVAGVFLIGICLRGSNRAKAQAHIAVVFTNALGQSMPDGFTNIHAARFNNYYGARSGIYSVERLDGDAKSSDSLLAALSHKNITVIEDRLRYDGETSRGADWWHPEQYGKGKFFALEGNSEGRHSVLYGYLFPESNGCALFLKLREP